LLLGTLGLLLICLLQTPLRWAGAVLAIVAAYLVATTPQPDILVAADGQAVAVRGADGRLAVARSGSNSFAIRDWLAADGDPRGATDPTLAETVRCDPIGCVLHLPNGRPVTLALAIEALEEDCATAAVVVSPREAQAACSALLIDRRFWRQTGATALFASGDGFRMVTARPDGSSRPWAYRPDVSTQAASAPGNSRRNPSPNDSTPRAEDIEAGD
jgi:competence protein ComEC